MQEILDYARTTISDIMSDLMNSKDFDSIDEFIDELQNIVPSATLDISKINCDDFDSISFGFHTIYYNVWDLVNPSEFINSSDDEEESFEEDEVDEINEEEEINV